MAKIYENCGTWENYREPMLVKKDNVISDRVEAVLPANQKPH